MKLRAVRDVLNNGLQGKLTTAYSDLGRVLINSTLGMLGLFDVASEGGIEKHEGDFGQTLGAWGIAEGAYLVLPILGPGPWTAASSCATRTCSGARHWSVTDAAVRHPTRLTRNYGSIAEI